MQKTVHILKELGAPFQERFEYSYYGMYSAQLKAELDTLEKEGLVTESESNPDLKRPFIIEATPKVGQLLTDVGLSEPPVWIEVAQQLNKLSSVVLEGISTILFLRRTETNESIVRERLLVLKPHLEQYVEDCFSEANRLPKLA